VNGEADLDAADRSKFVQVIWIRRRLICSDVSRSTAASHSFGPRRDRHDVVCLRKAMTRHAIGRPYIRVGKAGGLAAISYRVGRIEWGQHVLGARLGLTDFRSASVIKSRIAVWVR
jgi:hypothetical protein